ncbi:MAG: hypothetical protein IJ614_01150 [Prevotella sp.]|nr:hypothetical protein [Prevotella sp.]
MKKNLFYALAASVMLAATAGLLTACSSNDDNPVVTPQEPTDFAPAASYRSGSSCKSRGYEGIYWTSTVEEDPYYSHELHFYTSGADMGTMGRYCGFTIRPVQF